MSKPKTKRLPLTRGQFAIVDAEDYSRLAKYNWHVRVGRHGKSDFPYSGVHPSCRNLAHTALGVSRGKKIFVVPKNGNSLDCRKENLLITNKSFGAQHSIRSKQGKSSKYRGVSWNKQLKKWHAIIYKGGKRYSIGYFDSEKAAALAYDEKAREFYGEFAYQNFNNPVKFRSPLKLITHPRRRPRSKKKGPKTSEYVGVSFIKKSKLWRASVHRGEQNIHLGLFDTEIEAAKAYDKKAKEFFGNSAYLNFPDNKTRRSGPVANGVPAGRIVSQRERIGK